MVHLSLNIGSTNWFGPFSKDNASCPGVIIGQLNLIVFDKLYFYKYYSVYNAWNFKQNDCFLLC